MAAAATASSAARPSVPILLLKTRVCTMSSFRRSSIPRHQGDARQADAGGVCACGGVGAGRIDAVPEDAAHLAVLQLAARIAGVLGDVEVAEAGYRGGAAAGAVREHDRGHKDQVDPARVAR